MEHGADDEVLCIAVAFTLLLLVQVPGTGSSL
jgi:hypothetical protein